MSGKLRVVWVLLCLSGALVLAMAYITGLHSEGYKSPILYGAIIIYLLYGAVHVAFNPPDHLR